MRCFAALRQWELQTPDPTNDAAEFENSAEQGGEQTTIGRATPPTERKKVEIADAGNVSAQ